MGNIFSKKKKNKPATPKTTGNTGEGEAAAPQATKQPKISKRAPADRSNSLSSGAEPASPVPAPVVHEKTGKKKNGSKSDDPHENDAPSPSDAAAAPDATENRAAESAALGAGVEDFGTTLVQAQKHKVTKEDFDLLTVIGRGSFGKVMQVRHKKDGKIYAMKVMRKDAIIAKNQVTHTRDEKNILQSIRHPFIVNLNYAFQTKDKLYMILDYVNGGELFYHLKKEGKFSEERVKMYAAEISSALIHLHSHGIIYRDLKPENILLDRTGHIVITDFGLSKEVPKDDATHTFCGTPEYLAPEVLRGQGHSYPVDWWSLGTLIYEMLTGLPPFYSKHINVMYQKILNAQLTFPSFISDSAKSLLEGLLTREVDKRLGGDDVRHHPFFSGMDWEELESKKVAAPWVPPVRDALDTTQIDDYFTTERPTDSYVDSNMLDEQDKDIFSGFTFAGDAPLAGAN